MNSTDRTDFERELAVLFAAIDRPLTEARTEAFWRGLAKMALPEFCRCVERLLTELEEGDSPKYFTVSDLWAVKRRLRAAPVTYVHEHRGTEGRFDGWELRANRWLMRHIGERLRGDSQAYGPVKPCVPGELCYSPEQALAVPVLVQYKRAWITDMREAADESNSVPMAEQHSAWRDCMQRAEAEIVRQLREPMLVEAPV